MNQVQVAIDALTEALTKEIQAGDFFTARKILDAIEALGPITKEAAPTPRTWQLMQAEIRVLMDVGYIEAVRDYKNRTNSGLIVAKRAVDRYVTENNLVRAKSDSGNVIYIKG